MTRTEYMLHEDYNTWHLYAITQLKMSDNRAYVIWNNEHNKWKYIICESRNSGDTRLFIRTVTSILEDAHRKKGWWDTFTVTKDPTPKGLWLAKIVEYKLDKNGYINLEVETILPIDDVKFHRLFCFESTDGTWNSIAWWLMMVRSNIFLNKYDFRMSSSHDPNYKVLRSEFPELGDVKPDEIGRIMLHKYLRNEVTLEKIEECLNTPSDWDQLVIDIQKAVAYDKVDKLYGDKYPLFAKKVSNNVVGSSNVVYKHNIEWYLKRQLMYYDELIKDNKVEAISDETAWLDMIETALKYRKSLKDAEKASKKLKKKIS